MYFGNTLEVVAIDPDTGTHQVFHNPAPSESGQWGMAVGPDGNIYSGTLPNAHILRLNPRTGAFDDLGRPSESEQYIWAMARGSDGKMYAGTYPSAKLVRYDPASNRSEDLGRMDPDEQYARTVAASDNGYIYLGIGYKRAGVVAYNIATGEHRQILPDSLRKSGVPWIQKRPDGKIYVELDDGIYRADGWSINRATAVPAEMPPGTLPDGRRVVIDDQSRPQIVNPRTHSSQPLAVGYAGQQVPVYRLAMGPDGQVYGSTILPLNLFRLEKSTGGLDQLGELGTGETYSMLAVQQRLLMASYNGRSPLAVFDPSQPVTAADASAPNPKPLPFDGQDNGWRPAAMTTASDGKAYIGGQAGYGKLGGPLVIWSPDLNTTDVVADPIRDQSIVSLAAVDDLLVGGTTIDGGGGSTPTQSTAKLFLFDAATRSVVFSIEPSPNAHTVADLVLAPNGLVYGFADGKFFIFDPHSRQLLRVDSDASGTLLETDAIGVGPDGRIWGLFRQGIFSIDPATNALQMVVQAPDPITAGFVLDGQNLYYASESTIYRAQLS
jgi:streptogramin lyase